MNIDQTYKRQVRIRSGEKQPPVGHYITVEDVATGEAISNVFKVEIVLDVREVNEAKLTYYSKEGDRYNLTNDGQPVEETITVDSPEIDITAYEV